MDEVEDVTKEIHHMATSVELLAAEAKATGEKVDDMSRKVEKLEHKPGEKAEKLKEGAVATVLNLLLGALVGGILALLLK